MGNFAGIVYQSHGHFHLKTETNKNYNDMLQLFYDDFLSFVPLQLPQLLDVTTMEQPQFYDDYVLLSFPLAEPIRSGRSNGCFWKMTWR